jgi:hypothetical protein
MKGKTSPVVAVNFFLISKIQSRQALISGTDTLHYMLVGFA